jgi:hypothetical protein
VGINLCGFDSDHRLFCVWQATAGKTTHSYYTTTLPVAEDSFVLPISRAETLESLGIEFDPELDAIQAFGSKGAKGKAKTLDLPIHGLGWWWHRFVLNWGTLQDRLLSNNLSLAGAS